MLFLSFPVSASVLYSTFFLQLRSILGLSSASLHSLWSACESASSEVTLSTNCWGPSASRYPLNCLWEEEDSLSTFFSLSHCFEISAASHFCFLHSPFWRRAAFFFLLMKSQCDVFRPRCNYSECCLTLRNRIPAAHCCLNDPTSSERPLKGTHLSQATVGGLSGIYEPLNCTSRSTKRYLINKHIRLCALETLLPSLWLHSFRSQDVYSESKIMNFICFAEGMRLADCGRSMF